MYSGICNVRIVPNPDIKGIPSFVERVKCGFPSPAEDYAEQDIDFNEYLIKHHAATFTVKVDGYSMIDEGINSGDMLIVDRSITPKTGMIVVAILHGDFTVKKLVQRHREVWLYPGNSDYEPIKITEEMDFQVWGVVSHIIHHCKTS
jgi:DNA polymerase V